VSKRDWKDHFLSSGLPLEYSVAKVLHNLGLINSLEYGYERINEFGNEIEFSVDIRINHFTKTSINACILVECKYKHDGHKWIFTPFHLEDAEILHGFVPINNYSEKRLVSGYFYNKLYSTENACYKGIEICDSGSNPKTIKEAISQLKHSVPSIVYELFSGEIPFPDRSKISPAIIISVIVTTSEIWRLQKDTDLVTIRSSKDIQEIAKREKYVAIYENLSNSYLKYFNRIFFGSFDDFEISILEKTKNYKENLEMYYKHFAPKIFFAVEYDHLYSFFSKLISILDEESFIFTLKK
jgi:hypothetical protein